MRKKRNSTRKTMGQQVQELFTLISGQGQGINPGNFTVAFVEKVGGVESLAEIMADLVKDREVKTQDRVRLLSMSHEMMKLYESQRLSKTPPLEDLTTSDLQAIARKVLKGSK